MTRPGRAAALLLAAATAFAAGARSAQEPASSSPAPAPVTACTAVTPVPRPTGWWKRRQAAINRAVRERHPTLLFVGDSITESWERAGAPVWERFYGARNAANLGVAGDRTEHVLWRLQHGNLEGLEPHLAVVLIGTNNAGVNPPAETAQGVEAVVRLLRDRLPNARVLLLAILPRGAGPADRERLANDEVNRRIARLGEDPAVDFLDLGERFLAPGGGASPELMPDLLHPNEAGYRIWAVAIEPYVAAALEESPR